MLDHVVSKAPLKLPNMNFGPLKMGYVEGFGGNILENLNVS